MAMLQRTPVQIPVIVPVYAISTRGTFSLGSFCKACISVMHLDEFLKPTTVRVLSNLQEWIWTAYMESVPCCLTVNNRTGEANALFYTGIKKYSNMRQCFAKLRLSNDLLPGEVVRVDSHVFIHSYSVIVAYQLDYRERTYIQDSLCPLTSKTHHCPDNLMTQGDTLHATRILRERQIEATIFSFRLLTITDCGGIEVHKYGIHPRVNGLICKEYVYNPPSETDVLDVALEIIPEVDRAHERQQQSEDPGGGHGAAVDGPQHS